MSKVEIVAVTQPRVKGIQTADEFIAYAARVSNPSNQANTLTSPKLIKYLIDHKHWSPFEMVSVTMEIETTRDIARQILRHRSFSFQEFSQRYADPTQSLGFVTREARLQDPKNRQNSIELDYKDDNNHLLQSEWIARQNNILNQVGETYRWAVQNGIAKEQARTILPEGLTTSRLYMAGTLRSWIHYVDVRNKPRETQKEHVTIAALCENEIIREFPVLEEYFYPQPTATELHPR